MTPAPVVYASRILGYGALISFGVTSGLAMASWGLVCTSWLFGVPVALLSAVAAWALASGGPAPWRLAVARVAAALLTLQFIACDPVGWLFGVAALVWVFDPKAADWAAGTYVPATVPADAPGLRLSLPWPLMMPLFWPCYVHAQIDDGEPQWLYWGAHDLPMDPGPHRLRLHVRYFGTRSSVVDTPFEVPAGGQVVLQHHLPSLVFLRGWIG